MAEPDWMKKHGVTPKKLAVIGLLAAVLVLVLVYPSDEPPPPRRTAKKPAAASSRSRSARPDRAAEAAQTARVKVERTWPEIRREEALAHNPFMLSPSLLARLMPDQPEDQAVAADQQQQQQQQQQQEQQQRRQQEQQRDQALAALRQQGVNLLIWDGSQKIAAIGQRHLRVGDVLEGLRVVEINAQGVVLIEEEHKPR